VLLSGGCFAAYCTSRALYCGGDCTKAKNRAGTALARVPGGDAGMQGGAPGRIRGVHEGRAGVLGGGGRVVIKLMCEACQQKIARDTSSLCGR